MRSFLYHLIVFVFSFYYVLIIIRAFLPWIPHNRYNPVIHFVYVTTDKVLKLIKLGLPPNKIGFDVSPFVAILLLWITQQILLRLLWL